MCINKVEYGILHTTFLVCMYKSTGRATCISFTITLMSALANGLRRLYLLNLYLEVVHTCLGARYWSEVLCCTIPTYINDLEEVKVTEKNMLKFLLTF